MITRNLGKVQEALDALNPVQRNINELKYYRNVLNSPNHSNSECSSVCSMIDTLTQQHSEVVEALILYGNAYQEMDERLARSNNPDYQSSGVGVGFSYISAPEHQKGFWEKTWNQITLGDYSDDTTWLGSTVSIGLAFIGWDAPMDVRDFTANVSKGRWGWAVVSAISLIPIVGILGKGGKILSKGAKAIDTTAETIDAGSTITKNADLFGRAFNGGKILSITKTNDNIYKIADDSFLRVSSDLSTVTVKNVNLVENFKYIKKSDEALSNMRIAFNYKSVRSTKAEAVSYLQKLDISELRKMGYTDDAINAIFKGELPDTIQSLFIKSLSANTDVVDTIRAHYKMLEMPDADIDKIIQKMSTGVGPPGFQVHHKFPLEDSGSNDFGNLILIDSKSHSVFTGYQLSAAVKGKLTDVGEAIVNWPVPQSNFYSGDVYSLPNLLNDIESLRLP